MFAIKQLLGKKDKEGHNPKIMVCSKNLTFLAKTWTNAFEQNLQMTNSEYRYDKAKNIMSVGNVEIILVPTEEPSNIYGYSTCLALVDELDELDTQTAMEAVKSINDRVRQQIDAFRSPFIAFATTSQGLKGMYQTVMHFNKSGIGYVLMRARTRDNIFLPKDYVKNLYSIYNEKETKCLLEGVFLSIDSGLIFPDYSPDRNKLDSDLYEYARDNNLPIFIGQDFNCIQGDVLIDTIRGKVKIKSIKKGDYVLTRKGYKKVLRNVCKGSKMVQDFNNGLVGTPDHIAVTPEGDVELRKAKQFYCLKEQSTELLKEERKALLRLLKLKKLYSTEENNTETQKVQSCAHTISGTGKEVCTEIFMNIILERLQREITYITKTDTMITDLKHLSLLLNKNMLKCTARKKVVCKVRKVLQNLQHIIILSKGEKSAQEFQKLLEKTEHTVALLFALIAVKSLNLESKQQNDVQNVNINEIFLERGKLIKVWKDTVQYVENLLQEQVQLHIARNTDVIGKDHTGKEKLSKVYDIEVEDAHEFYANNILVHNCFGNNAVAFCIINGAIVAIKDYEFPDIRRAPEVFRYDFPTNDILWIPDMTYKEHFTEFKKELRAFNIKIAYRSCNPLVGDRNFACNKLFIAERLFICPMCKELETTLLTWQKDPRTGQPSKGGKGAPDHKGDCLGMVVHYLLSWKKELKPLYRVTLERLYEKRRARGAEATELEVHSRTLDPAQLKGIALKKAPNVEENEFNP